MRANPKHASHNLYVVERDQTLAGVLTLRELLAGREEASVAALMQRDVVCRRMGDSLASVLVHPAWLEFHTLPVLDEQSLFAGALGHKTCVNWPARRTALDRFGRLYRIGSALVKSAIGKDSPIHQERREE